MEVSEREAPVLSSHQRMLSRKQRAGKILLPGKTRTGQYRQEKIVDFDLRKTIMTRLCQSLLTLAARPWTGLPHMFSDQSNM